jgi:hypothetical protein
LAETVLVQYLTESADLPAAEKVLRDALAQRQAAWPEGHPEVAAGRVSLAAFLVEWGQLAEAEPLLLGAAESLTAHPQSGSPSLKRRRLDAVGRLVLLYDAWDKPEKAAEWRRKLDEAKKPAARPGPQ